MGRKASRDPLACVEEMVTRLDDYPPDAQWMIACMVICRVIARYTPPPGTYSPHYAFGPVRVTQNTIGWLYDVRREHERAAKKSITESAPKVVKFDREPEQ